MRSERVFILANCKYYGISAVTLAAFGKSGYLI